MSEERFQEKNYVLVYTPSDKTGYCIMLVYAFLLMKNEMSKIIMFSHDFREIKEYVYSFIFY